MLVTYYMLILFRPQLSSFESLLLSWDWCDNAGNSYTSLEAHSYGI